MARRIVRAWPSSKLRSYSCSRYVSRSNNPFFNLAFEQWLFADKSRTDRILFLRRNEPSVIIGRFQGAWKECRVADMERDKVNLVRRTSGGGAVYQDLGNSIFTFISPKHDASGIASNNAILVDALRTVGITGRPTGRNDIEVNGLKISGAAFKHSKERSLHHGTILLNLDMSALERYLTPNKLKLASKGVSSVAARVMNLNTIAPDLTHEKMNDALAKSFCKFHGIDSAEVEFVDESFASKNTDVANLVDGLKDWKWRFGQTPEFSHHMETRFPWGMIDVYFVVKHGVVEEISVFSDALDVDLIVGIQNSLLKVQYSEIGIRNAFPASLSGNLRDFVEWVVKNL